MAWRSYGRGGSKQTYVPDSKFGRSRVVTPILMATESCQKRKFFLGNFAPGTFVNQTFCVRSLCGGGRGNFSSRVHTEDISRSPSKSHRVLWSSNTKKCWSRQEDAEFDFSPPNSEHGSHFCLVICYLCSMISVGGEGLGMATPQSVEIVVGVCHS